jgi:hypothetical protein
MVIKQDKIKENVHKLKFSVNTDDENKFKNFLDSLCKNDNTNNDKFDIEKSGIINLDNIFDRLKITIFKNTNYIGINTSNVDTLRSFNLKFLSGNLDLAFEKITNNKIYQLLSYDDMTLIHYMLNKQSTEYLLSYYEMYERYVWGSKTGKLLDITLDDLRSGNITQDQRELLNTIFDILVSRSGNAAKLGLFYKLNLSTAPTLEAFATTIENATGTYLVKKTNDKLTTYRIKTKWCGTNDTSGDVQDADLETLYEQKIPNIMTWGYTIDEDKRPDVAASIGETEFKPDKMSTYLKSQQEYTQLLEMCHMQTYGKLDYNAEPCVYFDRADGHIAHNKNISDIKSIDFIETYDDASIGIHTISGSVVGAIIDASIECDCFKEVYYTMINKYGIFTPIFSQPLGIFLFVIFIILIIIIIAGIAQYFRKKKTKEPEPKQKTVDMRQPKPVD